MSQALTVYLPDDIFHQLQQTAQLAKQTADTIIAQSLSHSISPLLKDVPEAYQADVYPLIEMTEAELREEVMRTFPSKKGDKYEALLEAKKTRDLSETENADLEMLHRDADVLTFRKGYAAVLLNGRGLHVPTPNELPQPA